MRLRGGKGNGRYPQVPLAAECAVPMLMQVAADDQTHIGPMKFVEQPRPSGRHHARGAHDIVGWTFEEERLVQEQRGAAAGCAQLLVKPVILCMFPRQARPEKLRVDTNQTPAPCIQGPPIGGK